ncbi:MAG: alpha/beta hydrolase [Caedimonas sp.]|nr:alpha/beta hydrolase [Caedimonas sp.]
MPEVIINGTEGRIEARYHHGSDPYAPMALILHPHPEQGGTMNNKVTYALFRTFVNRGFNTLRFNFRGVGKSEGRFSQGEGELSDAASVLDWMQVYNPNASECWVAGFSFGAWIGTQLLMRRPELDGFISISPPANMYDFTFLAPCPVSGLIVQGDADTIVTKSSVDDLVYKLSLQRNIVVEKKIVEGADHFFSDHLNVMAQYVDEYLAKTQSKKTRLQA